MTGYVGARASKKRPEPKRLYLSGPMSGYEEYNHPAFNREAARLREVGYEVVNPAEIGHPGMDYTDLIREDIRRILDCEAVAVIEGWWASRGAHIETSVAGVLDMPIRSVEDWIERRKSADTSGCGSD